MQYTNELGKVVKLKQANAKGKGDFKVLSDKNGNWVIKGNGNYTGMLNDSKNAKVFISQHMDSTSTSGIWAVHTSSRVGVHDQNTKFLLYPNSV